MRSQLITIWQVLKAAFQVNKFYFMLGIVILLIVTSLPVANRLILAQIIDLFVGTDSTQVLIFLIIVYVGLTFLVESAQELSSALFSYLYRFDLIRFFIDKVYGKILDLDIEFFESSDYADLKAQALESFDWRPSDMIRFIHQSILLFLEAIFSGIVLFIIAPWQIIILIIASIPSLIVDFKMQTAAWDVWQIDIPTSRKYSFLMGMIWDTKHEQIKEARLLNIGGLFRKRVNELLTGLHQRQKQIQWRRSNWIIVVNIIPLVVVAGILVQSVLQVAAGTTTLGTFTLLITNILVFKNALKSFMYESAHTLSEARYVKSIFEFLNIESKIENQLTDEFSENKLKQVDGNNPPTIEFKDVTFRYPGTTKDVLKDFNLIIRAGEKVAFVGENGVGKTTIIKLLARFYDPTSGRILLNGIELKEYDLKSLRQEIGLLSQDFSLFEMFSVAENIGFGDIDRFVVDSEKYPNTPAEVLEAAENAKIGSVIRTQHMKGFNVPLGRDFDGVDFSGGERQRLALARTFYKDAQLIIMDEPTSAVDANAEMEIFTSLREHLSTKTVIFVSHRFSTVRIADRILVIEGGQIREDGSHNSLMEKKGIYHKMFTMQAEGYKEDTTPN